MALIEYSDPQCPFCAKVARDVLPALREHYVRSGRLLLAFRQFPLTIHAQAQKASEAAACAAAQGKFVELQDRLFAEPQRLAEADLRQHARQLGLDGSRFDRCLDGEMEARVRADMETGRGLGVSGTPTFFVGVVQPDGRVKLRQRINGAQPLGAFQAAIDGLTAGDRREGDSSTR